MATRSKSAAKRAKPDGTGGGLSHGSFSKLEPPPLLFAASSDVSASTTPGGASIGYGWSASVCETEDGNRPRGAGPGRAAAPPPDGAWS